jgi:hypothetical protein
MEKKENKPKEAFTPENTPTPPQVMDTRKAPERDEKKSENTNSTVPRGDAKSRPDDRSNNGESEKRLGESPLEIDDETTI